MTTYYLFLIRNSRTGLIEHHKICRADGLSPAVLAKRVIAQTSQLHESYPIETYDVSEIGYSSLESLRGEQNGLKIDVSQIQVWK